MPISGIRGCCAPPVVLPTSVSCLAPCSRSALIKLNGTPGIAKPPNAIVAPSGMSCTASRKLPTCLDCCVISPATPYPGDGGTRMDESQGADLREDLKRDGLAMLR